MKPFVHNHWIIKVADVSILVSGLYAFFGDFLLGVDVFSEVGKGFVSVLAIMIFAVIIVFISLFTVSCPNCKKLWILRTFFLKQGGFMYFIKTPKECPLCHYSN